MVWFDLDGGYTNFGMSRPFELVLFRLVPHNGSKKQRIANLSRSVCITNKWEVFMMVNHQEIIKWVYFLYSHFNQKLSHTPNYPPPIPDENIIMK